MVHSDENLVLYDEIDIDQIFTFDCPERFFYRQLLPLAPISHYQREEDDIWFQQLHPEHDVDVMLKKTSEQEQFSDNSTKENDCKLINTKISKNLMNVSKNNNKINSVPEIEIKKTAVPIRSKMIVLNSSNLNTKSQTKVTSTIANKKIPGKPAVPVQIKSSDKKRPVSPGDSSNNSDEILKKLLRKHNEKFAPVPLYEPCRHGAKDVKRWELASGKSWSSLTPQERQTANSQIADMKNVK